MTTIIINYSNLMSGEGSLTGVAKATERLYFLSHLMLLPYEIIKYTS